ncbi:hypothetical protein [Alkalicoccobacillus murimartini]|uniref:Uncharacterized membrane protein HdeD (DUF308 family) n=1 Tax=Alkalicoccobacillus murimartini TaxID=171685 RepID=A0ABT9YC83_9BACI|nr:hypothetical protein [Alkalicoccobacillus murimartini]MDQ0205461.1 uncharacterized membrane protein HdeD (DUF308 family) [Alkalicoccobacillus murimartini]
MPNDLLKKKLLLVNGYVCFCLSIMILVIFTPVGGNNLHIWLGVFLVLVGLNQLAKFRFRYYLTKWSKEITEYKYKKLGSIEWKKWDRHLFSIWGWMILGAIYIMSGLFVMPQVALETIPIALLLGVWLIFILVINLYVVSDNKRLKKLIQGETIDA